MGLVWMAIPLSQGFYALVDGDDYERSSKWKWCAQKGYNTFYAVRQPSKQRGKRRLIMMHREVLGLSKGIYTDHRNGCGLDNRKVNLRSATLQQNQFNRQSYKGTSRYKGVYWRKGQTYKVKQYFGKWRAKIKHNGRFIWLGDYDNETEAAKAYDREAIELFGEFVKTNF